MNEDRDRARPGYRDAVPLAEARRLAREALAGPPKALPAGRPRETVSMGRPPETVNLPSAAGRVLAEPVVAAEAVPGFDRSAVDGYAVAAADTYGASEAAPVLLFLAGQVVVGRPAGVSVRPGQAASIPTGGMVPAGADAVVMVEHTAAPGGGLVEVLRPVAPGENVVRAGEDVSRGSEVLPAGRRLTPPDLGVLAAVGVASVRCRPRPRVAIVPTGDEIVPASSPACGPGQVRDVTSVSLAAFVAADGGDATVFDVVPDRVETLEKAVADAVAGFDLVLVLGGSSVGARDHTAAVIDKLGPPGVIFHGLALKPGKPTIFGLCDRVPVFGLPGHPVSGLVVYRLLVSYILRLAGGERLPDWRTGGEAGAGAGPLEAPPEAAFPAVMATAVSSDQGREEYLCVRVSPAPSPSPDGPRLLAEPVYGKSGLITVLAGADGLVRIPAGQRGLERGARVEVIPLAW